MRRSECRLLTADHTVLGEEELGGACVQRRSARTASAAAGRIGLLPTLYLRGGSRSACTCARTRARAFSTGSGKRLLTVFGSACVFAEARGAGMLLPPLIRRRPVRLAEALLLGRRELAPGRAGTSRLVLVELLER